MSESGCAKVSAIMMLGCLVFSMVVRVLRGCYVISLKENTLKDISIFSSLDKARGALSLQIYWTFLPILSSQI